MSFAEFALLQNTARTVQWSLYSLKSDGDGLVRQFSAVKDIYKIQDFQTRMKDGDNHYPCESPDWEDGTIKGMKLEFR